MTYSPYPPPPLPPGRPPTNTLDVTLTVIGLVLTVLAVSVWGFMGLFLLAFLDYCPPESCSAEGAFAAVATSVVAGGVVTLVGLVVAIVRLSRRKLAWPFAAGALLLCIVAAVLGVAGYAAAV